MIKIQPLTIRTFGRVSGKQNITRATFASDRESAYNAGLSPHRPEDRSLFLANQAPAKGPTMKPIENAKPTSACKKRKMGTPFFKQLQKKE